MEPILTYSEITGRVYIVTKYKRLDGGVIDAREKYDVTEWVEKYARMRNGQVVAESDALRDLAYDMWEWMGRARYDGAIRCDEMDEIGRRAVGLGLLAHELGIEVDCQD